MTARAYYNEIEPYAAQWLRNLINENLVAPGDVDERSIADVHPIDTVGYTQCHFFAGIGGWSLALRLAGWEDDRPVWTGSCPCQPFSTASRGRGRGLESEKHLWPEWRRLIREARPPALFGEQVAGALAWLDQVWDDLEADDYALWPVIAPACAAGADHIRERLWFLAHPDSGSEYGGAIHAKAPVLSGPRSVGRRIQPTYGIPTGMDSRGAKRAFGNAIVPQVAAEIIAAYMECRP